MPPQPLSLQVLEKEEGVLGRGLLQSPKVLRSESDRSEAPGGPSAAPLSPWQVRPNTVYSLRLTHGEFTWTMKKKFRHFQELHRDLMRHKILVTFLPLSR